MRMRRSPFRRGIGTSFYDALDQPAGTEREAEGSRAPLSRARRWMNLPWSSSRSARIMTAQPSRAGNRALDAYLQRQASQDVRRRVAQVFVAVGDSAGEDCRVLQPERRELRKGRIAAGFGEAAAALSRAGRDARPPCRRSRAARARAWRDAPARCHPPRCPGEHGRSRFMRSSSMPRTIARERSTSAMAFVPLPAHRAASSCLWKRSRSSDCSRQAPAVVSIFAGGCNAVELRVARWPKL